MSSLIDTIASSSWMIVEKKKCIANWNIFLWKRTRWCIKCYWRTVSLHNYLVFCTWIGRYCSGSHVVSARRCYLACVLDCFERVISWSYCLPFWWPELTATIFLDFLLWTFLKYQVYANKPRPPKHWSPKLNAVSKKYRDIHVKLYFEKFAKRVSVVHQCREIHLLDV